MWTPKNKVPRFVKEGLATLENGDFYADDGNDGLAIACGEKPGFAEFIRLKPNAPLWAQDEYNELCGYYKRVQEGLQEPVNKDFSSSTQFSE